MFTAYKVLNRMEIIMIRLIAIDMDGTILSPDHSLSSKNREMILQAQSTGIEVLIATGRAFSEAIKPLQGEGLTLPYVCLNGAEVRDVEGKLISATHLKEHNIEQITTILEASSIEYQLFIDTIVYTLDIENPINAFIQLSTASGQTPPVDEIRKEVMEQVEEGSLIQIDSFDKLISERGSEIYKVFATSYNREDLDAARAALKMIPGLAISSSGAGNIEITNINAQKGIAVENYAKSKGISMDDVMAIGDNYNDLSMMERAGRAVAMKNAPTEIKAACTHMTESNANDGVGLAIETILELQESHKN